MEKTRKAAGLQRFMIFTTGPQSIHRLLKNAFIAKGVSGAKQHPLKPRLPTNAGNIFFALFAAVGMVGAVGYGFTTVIKGPINSMTEVTRRTVAESTIVTSSRLAIVGAITQQTKSGDCDDDAMIEPLPYRDAGAGAKPTGGGWLPTGLLPNSLDPWNTEYGYCAWDPGPISVIDADAGCGGATPRRLQGAPDNKHSAIAIISAGRDKTFQTSCVAYNGGTPNAPLVVRTPGSDDMILGYTYAEANDLGGGLWTPHKDPLKTATTTTVGNKNLDVGGGGTFTDKVVMTTGGLVLPDETSTGPCDSAVNDKQIRRNTSTNPPTLEICDFTGGSGWIGISGVSENEAGEVVPIGQLVGHWQLNEAAGTVAADRMRRSDGTLMNGATWAPAGGKLSGAASFTKADNEYIRIPRTGALEPTSITMAAWIKRNGHHPTGAGLINKTYNNHVGNPWLSYSLHFAGANNVAFGIGSSSGVLSPYPLSATLPDNQWVHIAGTYDPAGPAPQYKLYIDGILVDSRTNTAAIAYDKSDKGDLYIGGYSVSQGNTFNGSIDDVRVYNYALSASDIEDIYQLGMPPLNLQTPVRAGNILSWGFDDSGQLGTTEVGDRPSPGPVTNGTDFIDIFSKGSTACAVKENGTVWCWGSDSNGQLGNGPVLVTNQSTMTQVVGLTDAISVATTATTACALKKDGTAWCWGDNTNGQAGTGSATPTTHHVPVQVAGITDFIAIAPKVGSTCGVRSNGEAWCWGEGSGGDLGNGLATDSLVPVKVSTVTDFVSIIGAGAAQCGLTKRGIGYCWGTENTGNFGNGATSSQQNTPTPILNITDFSKLAIASYGCGLRANGQIWCWGSNSNGQIGNGTTGGTVDTPVQVLHISDFVDVSTGGGVSCGVRRNGEEWCWGADSYGRLGNGPVLIADTNVPSKVVTGNVLKIMAGTQGNGYAIVDPTPHKTTPISIAKGKIGGGYHHACYIDNANALWCWGYDAEGQLGNGGVITANQESPSGVDNGNSALGWTMVDGSVYGSAVNIHTCGIKTDGTAWCWGSDSFGQLGNGAGGASASPVQVSDVGPWAWIDARAGSTCGIKTDGTAWCWGDDTNGYLGNGAGGASQVPVAIAGGGTWKIIRNNCGIKTDGTLWCWGPDSVGQLGNGPGVTAAQQSPLQIGVDTDWKYVSGGGTVCAIKQSGTMWCWGRNNAGQVGIGNTVDQFSPTLVRDPGPWTDVITSDSGGNVTAIKMDGSLWSWGLDHTDGRLGNGTAITGNQLLPYPVDSGGQWKALAENGNGACAIKTDDSIWCWGPDTFGSLGNGTVVTAAQHSPYPVDMTLMKTKFVWSENGVTANTQGNLNLGTTPSVTPYASGSTASLAFPSANNVRLQTTAGANHTIVEGLESGLAAQMGIANSVYGYNFGYNAATGSFGLGHDPGWLSNSGVAFEVGNDGNVGIGTGGNPAANLDIQGALLVTTDTCSAAKAGTISYNSSKLQYCTGAGTLVDLKRTPPPALAPWDLSKEAIHSTTNHTCGTRSDGTLWCWGLGNRFGFPGNALIPVLRNSGEVFNTVTGSVMGTVAIRANGTALFIGNDSYGLGTGFGTDVWLKLALGSQSICGIKADGTIWCWGWGSQSTLGNGSTSNQASPVAITGGGTWIDITANYEHVCAIKSDGTAWCWGNNGGRLGNGLTAASAVPVQVSGAGAWKQISAGRYNTCGVKTDGTGWCWGTESLYGANGNGVGNGNTTTPMQLDGGGVWHSIRSSYNDHACGLKMDGTAWCWGLNGSGQVGNGNTTTQQSPVAVVGGGVWASISTGDGFSCGVKSDATAWCWGVATNGKLGNNTTTPNVLTPGAVLDQ